MTEISTGSGIRIVHPDDMSVSSLAEVPAGLARGAASTRAASGDDWAGLLRHAGFEHVDTLVFESQRAGLRRAPGEAAGPTTIDVPLPPEARAVLLVESDGLYHWALSGEDVEGAPG